MKSLALWGGFYRASTVTDEVDESGFDLPCQNQRIPSLPCPIPVFPPPGPISLLHPFQAMRALRRVGATSAISGGRSQEGYVLIGIKGGADVADVYSLEGPDAGPEAGV